MHVRAFDHNERCTHISTIGLLKTRHRCLYVSVSGECWHVCKNTGYYEKLLCLNQSRSLSGGLAVFVIERWCDPVHVSIKEQVCKKDIEFVAVGICPYYIPREFLHVIVFIV